MNNFEFREIDYDKDIPEIISLIHKNLAPEFTESFFRWKHCKNPFGKSYGLLALHMGRIIGLRMFMFWEFKDTKNDNILKAIRPVDTITDLDYRGKGLFKKLTLNGIDNCLGNFDIIFNTPNENSFPGYIKMGWQQVENSEMFKIGIIQPFRKILKFNYVEVHNINLEETSKDEGLLTNNTSEFLIWRYKNDFYKIAKFENSYIIFSITHQRGIKCLVIYELLGDSSNFNSLVHSLGYILKAPMIYYYESKEFNSVKFIKVFSRKKSIIVYKGDEQNLGSRLSFSLGDLEGKL